MNERTFLVTSIGGIFMALAACGKKDEISGLFTAPIPATNPAVLSVADKGKDFTAAPRNVITFDPIKGTTASWDMTYSATDSRSLQILNIGSSANGECSIGDATGTVDWTPGGGSPTRATVGDVIVPGDGYSVSAGKSYTVHFVATFPAGCNFATFNLVVVTPSKGSRGI